MKKIIQNSDSYLIAFLLFLIGGFQNAYTYINCNNVFANLQTGNLILMSISVINGNFNAIIKYLMPLSFFWLGSAIGTIIDLKYKNNLRMHWRTIILFIEMFLVIVAGLLPSKYTLFISVLVTLNSALSLQGFKQLHKRPLVSTMMVGNMRMLVDHLVKYGLLQNKEDLKEALLILSLLISFIIGALLAAKLSILFEIKTILFLIPLYLGAIIYLELNDK